MQYEMKVLYENEAVDKYELCEHVRITIPSEAPYAAHRLNKENYIFFSLMW